MIEISVYATSKDYAENICALRKRVDNDNFCVCYDDIIRANKCLFGSQCMISFVVLLLIRIIRLISSNSQKPL